MLIAAITIATTIALRSAYQWYSSSRSSSHGRKVTLDPNKRVPVTLMEKEVCLHVLMLLNFVDSQLLFCTDSKETNVLY